MPAGLSARSIEGANSVVWVDGTLDGSRVAVILDGRLRAIERVIVLPSDTDGAVTFMSRNRAVIAARGEAWIADLG